MITVQYDSQSDQNGTKRAQFGFKSVQLDVKMVQISVKIPANQSVHDTMRSLHLHGNKKRLVTDHTDRSLWECVNPILSQLSWRK